MIPTDDHAVEAVKMPRIVASSPNYTRQTPSSYLYTKYGPTKKSKSDKSNACADGPMDNKRKLSRAWGTPNFCPQKREYASKIGERVSKVTNNIFLNLYYSIFLFKASGCIFRITVQTFPIYQSPSCRVSSAAASV